MLKNSKHLIRGGLSDIGPGIKGPDGGDGDGGGVGGAMRRQQDGFGDDARSGDELTKPCTELERC